MVIANVLIPIFGIVMIQFKFINKLYKSFLRVAINLNKIRLVKYSIGMLIIAILLTSSVYMNLSFEQVMLVNTLVIIFYIWIEGKMTSSEVRYQDVEKKYMTSKAQLEAVEKEIDEYKTTNHEMKNTLRMIEDMIKRNDSETLKFIQKLQSKDIERKSVKADVAYQIPLPGLKSLFHDKLLEMENKSIEYDLHISKSVKPSKCHNIEDDDILSLCQIIGVLLDNSIQEVQNLNEKYVSIDIYTNHSNLFISISNNYETEPKIDKIFDAGYTTKGKGHGYGLALVKQIIDKSSNFLIETEVSKTTFRQILEIKM